MAKTNTCLQINMAPLDFRHIVHTLPHQLRMLGPQVSEVQFTLDNNHSRANRYATQNYSQKHAELRDYLTTVCKSYPDAYIVDVDYSPKALGDVALRFTGQPMPLKAYDGSPFHAYLFGLLRAENKYVFHIDSDMLFGGGSKTWIAEAIDLFIQHSSVQASAPLDGPPRSDGVLKSKHAVRNNLQQASYSWSNIGTRVFLIDRDRFFSEGRKIPLCRALGLKRLKSFLHNTSPVLPLEDCISKMMVNEGILRVDFLGSGNGLWQLHPPYRSERFYAELPNIIERIEANDIPDGQRGDHNLNDSMIDWSDARRLLTIRHKLQREIRITSMNLSSRISKIRS